MRAIFIYFLVNRGDGTTPNKIPNENHILLTNRDLFVSALTTPEWLQYALGLRPTIGFSAPIRYIVLPVKGGVIQ